VGTDGRTDMTKLIDTLRNFAKAPKKQEWAVNGMKERQ
jgi:hypothetical protein